MNLLMDIYVTYNNSCFQNQRSRQWQSGQQLGAFKGYTIKMGHGALHMDTQRDFFSDSYPPGDL